MAEVSGLEGCEPSVKALSQSQGVSHWEQGRRVDTALQEGNGFEGFQWKCGRGRVPK